MPKPPQSRRKPADVYDINGTIVPPSKLHYQSHQLRFFDSCHTYQVCVFAHSIGDHARLPHAVASARISARKKLVFAACHRELTFTNHYRVLVPVRIADATLMPVRFVSKCIREFFADGWLFERWDQIHVSDKIDPSKAAIPAPFEYSPIKIEVLRTTTLTPGAKIVFSRLIALAGPKDHWYGTYRKLGTLCGMARGKLREAVEELEKNSFIEVRKNEHRVVHRKGVGRSNFYLIKAPIFDA